MRVALKIPAHLKAWYIKLEKLSEKLFEPEWSMNLSSKAENGINNTDTILFVLYLFRWVNSA